MTKEEARNLKRFKHSCTCGGYACSLNGRDPRRPHLDWCPQEEEYNEWYDALHEEIDDRNDRKIDYRYLDVDNEIVYTEMSHFLEAIRNRKGIIVRAIPNYKYGQILYAGGTKKNAFGEFFSEIEAIRMCRRLTNWVNNDGYNSKTT